MKAVVFQQIGDIRLDDVPEPKIQESTDAIVRITASAICGTDLHMIRGTFPGMKPGTILGHEGVGVVEEIGPNVRNLKVGDAPRGLAREGSRSHSLHHWLWVLLLLPQWLLRTVRQRQPEWTASRNSLLRRTRAKRPFPGFAS